MSDGPKYSGKALYGTREVRIIRSAWSHEKQQYIYQVSGTDWAVDEDQLRPIGNIITETALGIGLLFCLATGRLK